MRTGALRIASTLKTSRSRVRPLRTQNLGERNQNLTIMRGWVMLESTLLSACRWVLRPAQYSASSVGSKCFTLEELTQALPDCIATPASAALPFAALQRVLQLSENAEVAKAAGAEALGNGEEHPAVAGLAEVRLRSHCSLRCGATDTCCTLCIVLVSVLAPLLACYPCSATTGRVSVCALATWRACLRVTDHCGCMCSCICQATCKKPSPLPRRASCQTTTMRPLATTSDELLGAIKRVWGSKWNARSAARVHAARRRAS